ncbi:hypothetical protein ACDY96_23415 [Rhizobium mongolense]|uniref:hypothetical protein n=1 Tax=Rhizobium mongolense TaxID=57676 RepID=UPI003556CFB3
MAGLVLAGRSAAAANNDLKWLYQKLRNEIESFEAEQVAVAYEEQTVRGIGVAIARLPVKGDSFEQIRVGDPSIFGILQTVWNPRISAWLGAARFRRALDCGIRKSLTIIWQQAAKRFADVACNDVPTALKRYSVSAALIA